MQLRQLSVFLLLLFLITGARAQTGTLELHDLPTYAEVYLDGKPLPRPDRTSTAQWQIPAGEHELQVEAWINNRVTAFRQRVTVENGQVSLVRVEAKVVRLTTEAPLIISGPQGQPGARGPVGAEGRPVNTTPLNNPDHILALTRESVTTLLADIVGTMNQIENDLWTPPKSRPVHADAYYFLPTSDANVVVPMIPGPSGPPGIPGLPGPPGLPSDVLIVTTPEGMKLIDKAVEVLELQHLMEVLSVSQNQVVKQVKASVGSISPNRADTLTPLISIQTHRWKEWLEVRYTLSKRGRGEVACICASGPTGKPGAPGPRGKDGEVPEDAPRIQLSDEQVQALLEQLKADTNLQNRIQQLKARVNELKNRVTEETATPQIP